MIKIICLGKIKEEYLNNMIKDYQKRISRYHKIEIIELTDSNNLEKEAVDIQKHINNQDYVIALDIDGEIIDSVSLAKKIDQTFLTNSTITFIIGGTLGIMDEILNKSNELICFSKMTFPHQLIRVFLLEQLFRAFKISNNETYHW